MAFSWKDKKDIWKGEGIYFVTFVVNGRQKLLGDLVRIMEDGRFAPVEGQNVGMPNVAHIGKDGRLEGRWDFAKYGQHRATVRLKPLGFEIAKDLQNISKRHEGYQLCGKQIMENHLHLVIWVHNDNGQSIKQWAHKFRMGITNLARDKGLWPSAPVGAQPVGGSPVGALPVGGSPVGNQPVGGSPVGDQDVSRSDGPGLVLEKAFIRTLSHSGQLKNMLAYTHGNPDNALLMRDNPGLYVIRRNKSYAGLLFDSMGKERLLDYPDRNVVALSRSLTEEQIAQEVQKALRLAESGAVTYCAAINDGEKAVTKAIRAAGFPLVVMMLDGFPPENSEAARYYHPNGVYHKACGEGRLYLLAPKAGNYNDARLIELTERELARKAAEKGQSYYGMPHTQKRWRMIAGNMMLKMIAGVE